MAVAFAYAALALARLASGRGPFVTDDLLLVQRRAHLRLKERPEVNKYETKVASVSCCSLQCRCPHGDTPKEGNDMDTCATLACDSGCKEQHGHGTWGGDSCASPPFEFEFVHDGHCAAGWMPGNTNQGSVAACASHCNTVPNCGFFAYSTGRCALYHRDHACPDDDQYPDYNAYRLIEATATPTPAPTPSEVLWWTVAEETGDCSSPCRHAKTAEECKSGAQYLGLNLTKVEFYSDEERCEYKEELDITFICAAGVWDSIKILQRAAYDKLNPCGEDPGFPRFPPPRMILATKT